MVVTFKQSEKMVIKTNKYGSIELHVNFVFFLDSIFISFYLSAYIANTSATSTQCSDIIGWNELLSIVL